MKQHTSPTLFLLASLLCVVPASYSQDDTPSFVEQVDVTLVELRVEVTDKKGIPVTDLTVDDLQIWEDDQPVEILGVDYPTEASPSKTAVTKMTMDRSTTVSGIPQQAPATTADWRFLIYIDGPLSGHRTIRRAMDILRNRVDEFVSQGPVEVVFANPEPRLVQAFTRDPEKIHAALDIVADEPAQNELLALRKDFLRVLDMRANERESSRAMIGRIRSNVPREHNIVVNRITAMSEWMAGYGDVPASAAIIVSDGFDLEPIDFYLNASAVTLDQSTLRAEFRAFRVDPLTDTLSKQLAATGWTSLMLTLGTASAVPTASDASLAHRARFRSIGEGNSDPGSANTNTVVAYPLEPLMMMAEQTGGEILTNRKRAAVVFDNLVKRVRVTYLAPRSRDGEVHEVRVKVNRPKVEVSTAQWVRSPTAEQTGASRARRLLVRDSDAGELPVTLKMPTKAAGGEESGVIDLQVAIDVNLIKMAVNGTKMPLSITLGVEIPGKPAFTHQTMIDFDLPTDRNETWPFLNYLAPIRVPEGTQQISVVVQDPATGVWGGAVTQLQSSRSR